MESWLMMISDYGFPIAITIYLLHRIEKKLDQVVNSINHLRFPEQNQPYSIKNNRIK
ncbi:YvrJ family protein [Bacillus shivajii]|uniref:YvrJ family protein n=1 Tax=Bacillus shivajii TaxID=1983719 RepID=UPI001CFC38EB|nr:YvrJ family protein [Bacillus shivajii]UCZ52048.1 YvrJ family protein [Bacillus shivajii]